MEGRSLEALRQLQMALIEGLLTEEEHAAQKQKLLQGTFDPSHSRLVCDATIPRGETSEVGEKDERVEIPVMHRTPEMTNIHERLFRTTRHHRRAPLDGEALMVRPASWRAGVKDWRFCSGHVQTTVYGWKGDFAIRNSWDSPKGVLWYRV